MGTITRSIAVVGVVVAALLASGCAVRDPAPAGDAAAAVELPDRDLLELMRVAAAIDSCLAAGADTPDTGVDITCRPRDVEVSVISPDAEIARMPQRALGGAVAILADQSTCTWYLPVDDDHVVSFSNGGPMITDCSPAEEAAAAFAERALAGDETLLRPVAAERVTACDVVAAAGYTPVADDDLIVSCGAQGQDWRLSRLSSISPGPAADRDRDVRIDGTVVSVQDVGLGGCTTVWTGPDEAGVGRYPMGGLAVPGRCTPAIDELLAELVPAFVAVRPADVDLSSYLIPAPAQ
ncbi:hypothetical protein [Microbacterium rhizophilus]|uniref:hypothetical protein n=1 Tax=Microbacterium rhizophilus TaxID=3138934 RepID=UPI0031EBFDC6